MVIFRLVLDEILVCKIKPDILFYMRKFPEWLFSDL